MIETFITYKSEYKTDQNGNRLKFRYDEEAGDYARDEQGELIEDPHGQPFRQWRDEINSPPHKGVRFHDTVKAHSIPSHTVYSKRIKQTIWSSAQELEKFIPQRDEASKRHYLHT